MVHLVVGLVGLMRHGKSSAAATLVAECGFQEQAFASGLKEACRTIFLLSEEQLYGTDAKERVDPRWGVSPRQLLQTVGTELLRKELPRVLPHLHPESLWCHRFRLWLESHPANQRVVLSDVRFADEVQMLRSLDAQVVLIRVVRPTAGLVASTHASEQESASLACDLEWHNDGTLEDLRNQVLDWWRRQQQH